jgi:hypothetical protein
MFLAELRWKLLLLLLLLRRRRHEEVVCLDAHALGAIRKPHGHAPLVFLDDLR